MPASSALQVAKDGQVPNWMTWVSKVTMMAPDRQESWGLRIASRLPGTACSSSCQCCIARPRKIRPASVEDSLSRSVKVHSRNWSPLALRWSALLRAASTAMTTLSRLGDNSRANSRNGTTSLPCMEASNFSCRISLFTIRNPDHRSVVSASCSFFRACSCRNAWDRLSQSSWRRALRRSRSSEASSAIHPKGAPSPTAKPTR
mmetsp:Transcript_2178/g.5170  ORF Transcript_2178/g.5170 Transcript_2178/m.5170 type:complete len:203 (+) Transcript_2178:174-782(+)